MWHGLWILMKHLAHLWIQLLLPTMGFFGYFSVEPGYD